MKKRIVVFVVLSVLLLVSYTMGFSFGKERDEFYQKLEVFSEGLAVIEKKYVEDKTPHDLIYGAMRGMLLSLDSYSQFLTPEDYRNLLIETEGQFGGLGIEITIRHGVLTIVSPIEGTPAWKAGLKPGDIITKIDGESTKNITINEAVRKLRGEPGTTVTIAIFREATRKVQDLTLSRDIIRIKDIKHAMILDNGIGYVRIAEFRETTAKDLSKTLEDLEKQGLKALILDVRNNPGGLLNSAIDISSRFLETGQTIVLTKSRDEAERVYKSLPFQKKYLDIPIVILINQGSASGSEIVAAALRENNRAILLGQATFGKGSVQTIIPLSDGSALRLTTSKYYTPSGSGIHEKGVNPDIKVAEEVVQEDKEDKEDIFKELKEIDFDYNKDYQIVRALDLIRGIMALKK